MSTYNIIAENLKVLVFHSDIDSIQKVKLVQNELLRISGIYRADIDLDDWEHVLRVECHPDCSPKLIEEQIAQLGFTSSEFTDY